MTTLALIAASIAATAVAGFWLWTRPDIRARLASHWARLVQAAKPHQALLTLAAGGLVAVVALIDEGVWAALSIVIATAAIRLCQQVAPAADEQTLTEAYADALNDISRATDLATARDTASRALRRGTYFEDLAAVRAALDERVSWEER
jgi:hypothetical protein